MCVRGLVGACVCAWACACEHVCACGRTCLHTRTRVFPKRPLHPHGRRPALAAPTLAMQAPDVRVQVPCTRAHAWAQAPGPQDCAAHRRDLPGHCGRKSSRTAADCQSLLRPAAPPSALRARTLLPGGGSTLRAPPCRRCAGHCHGTLRPSTIRGRGRGAALRRGPRPRGGPERGGVPSSSVRTSTRIPVLLASPARRRAGIKAGSRAHRDPQSIAARICPSARLPAADPPPSALPRT